MTGTCYFGKDKHIGKECVGHKKVSKPVCFPKTQDAVIPSGPAL